MPFVRVVIGPSSRPIDLKSERRVEDAAARQPVQLTIAEREPVLVARQRQHLLARLRRGLCAEQHHLELALGGLDQRLGEGPVRRDRPDLARVAQEDGHLVAERGRQPRFDPCAQLVLRLASRRR